MSSLSSINDYNSKSDFNHTAILLENVALVGDLQNYYNNDANLHRAVDDCRSILYALYYIKYNLKSEKIN